MRSSVSISWLIAALSSVSSLSAQPYTSPADRGDLEGSSYTHYPLGRHSARVQTLHDDIPGGTIIMGHSYRRDAIAIRGATKDFQSDIRVTLSIAPHPAAQAAAAFASNIGPNAVVCRPRTMISFPSTVRPQLDPAPSFEMKVPYSIPFIMPSYGGTLCVDVEIFGNQSTTGSNQNLSLYLDAHRLYADGRAQQPGFRFGSGCPAPGSQNPCYANMDFWRLPNGTTSIDVAIRQGIADPGSGITRAFLTIGNQPAGWAWPLAPGCPFYSSAELWFALPGSMSQTGSYDGSQTGLPRLPPGHRLWCQTGSINLGTVEMAFSDALTVMTPPAGALPTPAARIAHGSNQAAITGTISASVPVMQFF